MRIFLGYDAREERALAVATRSAERYGHEVIPLHTDRLRDVGLFTRPVDTRGGMWDLHSSRPQSTEFALGRFAVPILGHSGYCLYADCDVVFMRDPREIVYDPKVAVSVVKHANLKLKQVKMDGQVQRLYPRKLWSSVMLFNCDHPSHKRLTLTALNCWNRDELHALRWLADEEIGSLPMEANWLVNIHEKPERPIIAHYTLGTPDMEGHEHDEHADLWLSEVSQR